VTKIKAYLGYFSQNKELRSWLIVLITFKVADGLAGPLLKPLMVDMGLSFTQIGIYITMLGAVAALLGALSAGWMLKHISRSTALMTFSILKIMSLGGYAYLAYAYEQKIKIDAWLIYAVNALEDAFAAMLLVVMLTLVMHYSRKNYAGTDFTFQVSVMATVSGGVYSFSG
ncbi:TPA: MFS transporter, partial [Acinetobacter baumannii]